MLALLLAILAFSPEPTAPEAEPVGVLTWRVDPFDCTPDPIRIERAGGLDDEDDDDGVSTEMAIVVVTVMRFQGFETMVPASDRWVTMTIPGFAPRLRC